MEKQQKLPNDLELRTVFGDAYDVPVGGSLGLLALGYSGLMLWRHKRAEAKKNAGAQSEIIREPKEN